MISDDKVLQQLLLEEAQCIPLAGHMSARKVFSALQQRVWQPQLTLDVCTFICGYLVYQRAKNST